MARAFMGAGKATLSVLIVEDDQIHKEMTTLLVRGLGFDFESAVNGYEALRALERRRFDVVLMDLHMPVMDGITATREIHRRWLPDQRPKIIAMTATDIQGERERYVEAGAIACLGKPIDREELTDLLRLVQQPEGRGGVARIKVLVIDDDPVITAVYRKQFTAAGFIVETAGDPIHGFVRLQVFHPDVVVLDLKMPLRSGLDVLSDIRRQSRYRSLPVLIVTGEPEDSPQVQQARDSDATNVLFKSQWNPEALVAAVNWLIAKAPAGTHQHPSHRKR